MPLFETTLGNWFRLIRFKKLWDVSVYFESNDYLMVLWIGTKLSWLPRVLINALALIIMTPSV